MICSICGKEISKGSTTCDFIDFYCIDCFHEKYSRDSNDYSFDGKLIRLGNENIDKYDYELLKNIEKQLKEQTKSKVPIYFMFGGERYYGVK